MIPNAFTIQFTIKSKLPFKQKSIDSKKSMNSIAIVVKTVETFSSQMNPSPLIT